MSSRNKSALKVIALVLTGLAILGLSTTIILMMQRNAPQAVIEIVEPLSTVALNDALDMPTLIGNVSDPTETPDKPRGSPKASQIDEDPAEYAPLPLPAVASETPTYSPAPATQPEVPLNESAEAQPEYICPADSGVTLDITKIEQVDESGVFDIFDVTLVLDNRFNIPVSIRSSDIVKVVAIRQNGAEMGGGSGTLGLDYEVPPGKSMHVISDVNTFRNFGSPVAKFSLRAQFDVSNGQSDSLSRGLFCEYSDVEIGEDVAGNWGS